MTKNATDRQIIQVKDKALTPVAARVAERITREQAQRQRESVLSSVSQRLPWGISERDQKSAIAKIEEALAELPTDASLQDMEEASDAIAGQYEADYREKAKRAEERAARARDKEQLIQFGLSQVYPYAKHLIEEFDYNPVETAFGISCASRMKSKRRYAKNWTGMKASGTLAAGSGSLCGNWKKYD